MTSDRDRVAGPWVLIHDRRPWTVNGERSMNLYAMRALVRTWRNEFNDLATKAGLPTPIGEPVIITCQVTLRDGRRQDTGNAYPALKAAIDGLVDAGVLAGDGPDDVHGIMFLPPDTNSPAGDTMGLYIETSHGGWGLDD